MNKLLKNKKVIIPIIILAFIISGIFLFLYYKESKSGNLKAKETISEIKDVEKKLSEEPTQSTSTVDTTETDKTKTPDNLKDTTYYPIENVYDVLHRMSNSKIVAEDNEVWGRIDIDKDALKSIKGLIEKVNYKDRSYLLEVVSRWENNDFSQAVDEHNYFWDKLGGTVGKAISLNE